MVRSVTMFAAAVAAVVLTVTPTLADDGDPVSAELEAMGLGTPIEPEEPAALQGGRAVVPATLVLQDGDTPAGAGGAVSLLGTPFASGAGAVGFTGDVDVDDDFVWFGSAIVWQNSDALPTVLSGGETTMGVSATGGFIYSPSTDGADSVWTDSGQLAVENVQAPGMPAGFNSTFHSRPTMIPTGQAYWVAGHNDGAGGTSSVGRILYTSSDGTPATVSLIFKTGDTIGGQVIDTSGVDFDYDFSDDGSHHIHALDMTGSTTTDGFLYVDGALVAQEGTPNGSGVDNWDNFDYMNINNAGNYLFTGDTDGATGTDEFIAYNGTIAVREGDTVGGIVLASSMFMRGVAINNLGQAAFVVSADTVEHLFFACDASDLAGTAELVLVTGDQVDVDGGGADATVTDFNTSTHGLSMDDSGRIYVEVDLDYGAGALEAVIGIDLPSCGSALAMNEIRIDQPGGDNDEFFELYGTAGASLDGLTYLVIGDGTGGSGVIEEAEPLTGLSIPPSGFFVAAEATFTLGSADLTTDLNFENSDNVTHLLVSGFTGAVGDDLDTNDDCVLDATPWASVVDGVALIEEPNPPVATECEYATGLGLPTVGPDGAFAPGLTGRDPDGTGPWVIGPFDPLSGGDTPGASNNGTIPVELMGFSVE